MGSCDAAPAATATRARSVTIHTLDGHMLRGEQTFTSTVAGNAGDIARFVIDTNTPWVRERPGPDARRAQFAARRPRW